MKFYETVLEVKLERSTWWGNRYGVVLDWWMGRDRQDHWSFAKEWYKPSQEGTSMYFTAYSGDLQTSSLASKRLAEGAHARAFDREYGFMAVVLDTEGNRIALHSVK